MRVAALYDIHANLPALEAVLADVPEDATIVLGGDHVYGPFPAETINAGSVGMAYEDEPGAYWALLGPTVELRHSRFVPAPLAGTGYPRPWPTPGRAEATRQLEAQALGGG
jgi:hypothetical protein